MGGESYILNDKLRRSAPLNDQEESIIKGIDEKLKNIAPYNNSTFRLLHFEDKEMFDKYVAERQEGSVFSAKSYISTSKNINDYSELGQAPYMAMLKINGKNGKDISYLRNNGENEVLFARNTTFKVKNAMVSHDRIFFGEIDEV